MVPLGGNGLSENQFYFVVVDYSLKLTKPIYEYVYSFVHKHIKRDETVWCGLRTSNYYRHGLFGRIKVFFCLGVCVASYSIKRLFVKKIVTSNDLLVLAQSDIVFKSFKLYFELRKEVYIKIIFCYCLSIELLTVRKLLSSPLISTYRAGCQSDSNAGTNNKSASVRLVT